MNTVVLYVHGKHGSAAEADHYRPLFPDCDVVGLGRRSETPWDCTAEFRRAADALRERYDRVYLIANSVGAYLSMCAFRDRDIDHAWFISPIVDMERLILDLMDRAHVTEERLEAECTIETAVGETLSWDYLRYVRAHPIRWNVPTAILYGERDALTSLETVTAFAEKRRSRLTVMPGGEHWFHTAEQMRYLDAWIVNSRTA